MTWQTLKRTTLLTVRPWLTVIREEVLLEDGTTVIPDFYLIEGPRWASVFALTPDEHVVMLRSYLHGLRREALSFPGGIGDSDEGILTAARRELLEESGYTAPRWDFLGAFVLDGNRLYSEAHFYLARGAVPAATPDSGDLEHQTVERIPLAQVRETWAAGGFATVPVMTLVGLALNKLAAGDPG